MGNYFLSEERKQEEEREPEKKLVKTLRCEYENIFSNMHILNKSFTQKMHGQNIKTLIHSINIVFLTLIDSYLPDTYFEGTTDNVSMCISDILNLYNIFMQIIKQIDTIIGKECNYDNKHIILPYRLNKMTEIITCTTPVIHKQMLKNNTFFVYYAANYTYERSDEVETNLPIDYHTAAIQLDLILLNLISMFNNLYTFDFHREYSWFQTDDVVDLYKGISNIKADNITYSMHILKHSTTSCVEIVIDPHAHDACIPHYIGDICCFNMYKRPLLVSNDFLSWIRLNKNKYVIN